METTFACACCGRLRLLSGRIIVNSDALCWSCAEAHTILCDRCGERVYRRDAFRSEDRVLCTQCYKQIDHP